MSVKDFEVWPGTPAPLGAHFDGSGTNFSLVSGVADKVELCLFSAVGVETRVSMPERSGDVWHAYLPGVLPGQHYGYRVHGLFAPEEGIRCNPNKLLLDPYAYAIEGSVRWTSSLYDYQPESPFSPSAEDSSPDTPRSVVVNPFFDWDNDRPPNTPWNETVIYELHAKGFSMRNENIPEELRGTYAGLGHRGTTQYLQELGVSAVELMPSQHFIQDHRLVDLGMRNYWGYNSIGYFAPHRDYARSGPAGSQVAEFKQMVKSLHLAGIEVILDVVYNHTAEAGHGGPSLCFRGLDNPAYYRLNPDNKQEYIDYTGCGNSMNMRNPHTLQLIMDSLRYWVVEMHVDGFRFDLAATLAREVHAVEKLSVFFSMVQQDPVLQKVKLIAEPWDIGESGYHVGNFPPQWSEWNGQYRDTVRDYWRGEKTLAEFASRITGSSDLYEANHRMPRASINFVTAHDGFTMHDLVSYNEKHNHDNGEEGRDGDNHNRSWNCGAEGASEDSEIIALRSRQQRNFFATLLLSQGVPMILAGDEFSRTQGGNNNPYCQDNELSWIDWSALDTALLDFVRGLVAFRKAHPVFRRRSWFRGQETPNNRSDSDIGWYQPSGQEMQDSDWHTGFAKGLGVFLSGHGIASADKRGRKVLDESFFLLFNASSHEVEFTIPRHLGEHWTQVIDTELGLVGHNSPAALGTDIAICGRGLRVYQRTARHPC